MNLPGGEQRDCLIVLEVILTEECNKTHQRYLLES